MLARVFGEGHRFDDLKRWYTTEEIKNIFTENEKQGAEYFKKNINITLFLLES